MGRLIAPARNTAGRRCDGGRRSPRSKSLEVLPMTFAKTLASATALMLAASAVAGPGSANPAVIFDLGGKFDRSFNQASFEGAERFKAETGIAYEEFELQNDAQREQALRRFAERGHNPVVVAGFSYGSAMETVAPGVPRHRLRHHRHGGRAAERALGGLQRARGLLPRRRAGGDGVEDRQGRLRRRHGHPADPEVRLRLRAGRQGDQPRRRGLPEHDRHHRRRLERPGARRRAGQEPDRPRRRRRLPRRRRHRHRRAAGGGGRRRRSASASIPTRTTCTPARC